MLISVVDIRKFSIVEFEFLITLDKELAGHIHCFNPSFMILPCYTFSVLK